MQNKIILLLLIILMTSNIPAFSQENISKTNDNSKQFQPISFENNISEKNNMLLATENSINDELTDSENNEIKTDQNTENSIITPEQKSTPEMQAENISPFIDTPEDNWAYKSVLELSKKYKILVGYPDKTFKGSQASTRYEMAQLVAMLAAKIEEDQIKLSSLDQAAIKGLKAEFEKEILTLAARIEKNESKIVEVEDKHNKDVNAINSNVDELKGRLFFSPEIRYRYAFGEFNTPPDGAYANTRVRLTSNTKAFKDTYAILRLNVETANILKMSEVGDEVPEAKLTLGYIKTGDLTSWVPKKFGKFDIYGGLMPTNRLFVTSNYTINVDQRGFSSANSGFSVFGDMITAIARESTNGRRINIGGEYIKQFCKYKTLIKASVLRSGGGSLDNINKIDIPSSGKESTFFSAMAQMDIPVRKQPVEFKVAHFYSHDDNGSARNTYSIGGRLSTKFNNIGVFKIAGVGYGGTVAPRIIEGVGGKGFSLQFSYSPTIKAFGNLFGDPDKITHQTPNYIPGKTEVAFSVSHFKNGADVTLNAFDLTFSRYFTSTIWGRITFSRMNPSLHSGRFATRDAILLETIFNI